MAIDPNCAHHLCSAGPHHHPHYDHEIQPEKKSNTNPHQAPNNQTPNR